MFGSGDFSDFFQSIFGGMGMGQGAFEAALKAPVKERGFELQPEAVGRKGIMGTNGGSVEMGHGAVVIAAIKKPALVLIRFDGLRELERAIYRGRQRGAVQVQDVKSTGLDQGILAMNEARGAIWTEVHNAYLNYGVDLGWAGFVLFVALLANGFLVTRVERALVAAS